MKTNNYTTWGKLLAVIKELREKRRVRCSILVYPSIYRSP